MTSCAFRRLLTASVFIVITVILVSGCSRETNDAGFIIVDTEDNPNLLPYRFISVGSTSQYMDFPIQLYRDGQSGFYALQLDSRRDGERSAVVFRRDTGTNASILKFINVLSDKIASHYACDADGDSIQELVITYTISDTVWLDVTDAFENLDAEVPLMTSTDRNGDGKWDGVGWARGCIDVNQDGKRELLCQVYTHYDLLPRTLLCLDWFNKEVLWSYDVPGSVSNILTLDAGGEDTITSPILFTTNPPCNGVELNGMNDCSSCLVMLDQHGMLQWRHKLGEDYGRLEAEFFDYQSDGTMDIIAAVSRQPTGAEAPAELVVYDLSGNKLRSLQFARSLREMTLADVDGDAIDEVCLFFGDGAIHVYSNELELLNKYLYDKPFKFVLGFHDYLNRGDKQFLLSPAMRSIWLFDSEFSPLAYLEEANDAHPIRDSSGIVGLMANTPEGSLDFRPTNNSRLRVLMLKYRGHILVAAGLLICMLFLIVYYQRRTNRQLQQIAAQKAELEGTYNQLRETQAKLVAAEKYRQAKDIAGGVAHEIKNALCPAVNSLDKLNSRLSSGKNLDPERDVLLLSLARRSVQRGMKMTDLVSAYTRLEHEKKHASKDVRAELQKVVDANRDRLAEIGVDITIDVEDCLTIACAEVHLYSIVNNLLVNALDAVEEVEKPSIAFSAFSTNGNVTIRCIDSGTGVPQGLHDRVFDLFVSSKPNKGMGFGLAIVKRICDLYGGTVSLYSNDPGKTIFEVMLPSSQKSKEVTTRNDRESR